MHRWLRSSCACIATLCASCDAANEPASGPPPAASLRGDALDGGHRPVDATNAAPPKLLFKSAFGSGVTLGPPQGVKDISGLQPLSGTDRESGFAWPIAALNSTFTGVQLITAEPVDGGTVEEHITNQIHEVDGPNGAPLRELSQIVLKKGPVGSTTTHAQAPLLVYRPWDVGDIKELYISYWFRHQANLKALLSSGDPGGGWRTQFEFKTGGYENDWRGDYRIATSILNVGDKLIWFTKGDNVANGPWAPKTFWSIENRTVPVPVGTWFRYEIYWHRSTGTDGRFWSAVNGAVIVDYKGPTMGDLNLPINRIMINNAYSGGLPPVESHTTLIEMWSGFPCGEGTSCYQK